MQKLAELVSSKLWQLLLIVYMQQVNTIQSLIRRSSENTYRDIIILKLFLFLSVVIVGKYSVWRFILLFYILYSHKNFLLLLLCINVVSFYISKIRH